MCLFFFALKTVSSIWHSREDVAKEIIKKTIKENFFSHVVIPGGDDCKITKHIGKLAEWFYSMLKKRSPWDNWTNDIYDAMRCIDHLPIT